MKIIAISDEGNFLEPLWIVTVEISSDKAVDVEVNGKTGRIGIKKDIDGSEVFHPETGQTFPNWPYCADKAVDLVKYAYDKGYFVKNAPDLQDTTPARITAERYKQIAFQTIQMLRKVTHTRKDFNGRDWKDTDDWVFSELDLEKQELIEIFSGYSDACIYTGSCFDNGESPKDYDQKYFNKDIFAERLFG